MRTFYIGYKNGIAINLGIKIIMPKYLEHCEIWVGYIGLFYSLLYIDLIFNMKHQILMAIIYRFRIILLPQTAMNSKYSFT
jgi:hypothetical protein